MKILDVDFLKVSFRLYD